MVYRKGTHRVDSSTSKYKQNDSIGNRLQENQAYANYRPGVMTLHSLGISTTTNHNAYKNTRSLNSNSDPLFTSPQRLHKILAHCGIGSRRDMEQLILEGRVSVNSKPAEIGQTITEKDVIKINGVELKFNFKAEEEVILAYNKPEGEMVTRSDPQNRRTIFSRLPNITGRRWVAIGRLDYNTQGLLLISNSGDISNKLMHPRYQVEREYCMMLDKELKTEDLNSLLSGIELEDGLAKFNSLSATTRPEAVVKNNNFKENAEEYWYKAVICEGKNREIRRMLSFLGYEVLCLIRTRYGEFTLPNTLKQGRWWKLTGKKVKEIIYRVKKQDSGPNNPISTKKEIAKKSTEYRVSTKSSQRPKKPSNAIEKNPRPMAIDAKKDSTYKKPIDIKKSNKE